MEAFIGVHSEWNLGSPGGWDYQRMTQEIGKACWERVRALSGIDLELDQKIQTGSTGLHLIVHHIGEEIHVCFGDSR